jgi:hypothetical protein
MADIKQAAKWMQEGKRVRQPNCHPSIALGITPNEDMAPEGLIVVFVRGVQREEQDSAPFTWKSLLAEDWEVAE